MTVPVSTQWDLLAFTEGLNLKGTNLPPWDGFFVSAAEGGGFHGEGVDWLPIPGAGWPAAYSRDVTDTKMLLNVPAFSGQDIVLLYAPPTGDMEWRVKITPVTPLGMFTQVFLNFRTATAHLGVWLLNGGATTNLSINTGFWTTIKSFAFTSQIEIRVTYNSTRNIAHLWLDGDYITSWTPIAAAGLTSVSVSAFFMPASVTVDELLVGTHPSYGYYKPKADAGPDRVTPVERWAGFDARRSSVPSGKGLYRWKLIQAPAGSVSLFESPIDGTVNTATEFDPGMGMTGTGVAVGDVLIVQGQFFDITSIYPPFFFNKIGVAGGLPTGYTGNYQIVKQAYTLGATTKVFSIFPDVRGIFVSRLEVFDKVSGLYSSPDIAVCNAVPDTVPLGLPLDMGWLWEYLSDFWRLMSNQEWVKETWMALARIVASYTHDLWNVDFDKSLATTQNVASRRWLQHPPSLAEFEPDKAEFVNRRAPAVSDYTINLASITGAGPGFPWTLSVTLYTETGPQTRQIVFPGVGTWQDAIDMINADLAANPPFDCVSLQFRRKHIAGTLIPADLYAIMASSTSYAFMIVDDWPWWSTPQYQNSYFSGTAAYRKDASLPRVYVLDGVDLDYQIKPGDLISMAGAPYTIIGITQRADSLGFRCIEVELDRDLPSDLTTGLHWCVPSYWVSTITDWYRAGCTPGDILFVERRVLNDVLSPAVLAQLDVAGVGAKKIGTLDPMVYWPSTTLKLNRARRHFYIYVDAGVLEIPRLQAAPDMPDWVMEQWKDFVVGDRRDYRYIVLDHTNEPAGEMMLSSYYRDRARTAFLGDSLWAEETLVDNRPVIEANFGRMVQAYVEDFASSTTANYLSIVTGLWMAYANGPTPENIAKASAIIGGYPYAENTGIILAMALNFVPGLSYVLAQDLDHVNVIRSYVFSSVNPIATNPATGAPYAIGDTIQKFDVLVESDLYFDWVKDPNWWKPLRGAGFFTEPEKVHKFGVLLDIDYMDVAMIGEVVDFVLDVKKSHTYPLFSYLIHRTSIIDVNATAKLNITLTFPTFLWDYPVSPHLDTIRTGAGTVMDPLVGKDDDKVLFRMTVPGEDHSSVQYSALVGGPAGVAVSAGPPYVITVAFDPMVTTAADVIALVNADPFASPLVTAYLPPGAIYGGSNIFLVWTAQFDAVTLGTPGITLELRADAPATGIVFVIVGNAIQVTYETGTTMATLVAAINAHPVAGMIIQASFPPGCNGSGVLPGAPFPWTIWGPAPVRSGADTIDREIGLSPVNYRGRHQMEIDGGPGCGYPFTMPFSSQIVDFNTANTFLSGVIGANPVAGVTTSAGLPGYYRIRQKDVLGAKFFHAVNPTDPSGYPSLTDLQATHDWLVFHKAGTNAFKSKGKILGAGNPLEVALGLPNFGRSAIPAELWVDVYISPAEAAGGKAPLAGDTFIVYREMPDRTAIKFPFTDTTMGMDIGDNDLATTALVAGVTYDFFLAGPSQFLNPVGSTNLIPGQDYFLIFDPNGNLQSMAQLTALKGQFWAQADLVYGAPPPPAVGGSIVILRNPAYTFFDRETMTAGLALYPVGLDVGRRWPNMVVTP